MPKIDNHPVRLARIAAGLSMRELADAASLDRSTVAAIEDGRTRTVPEETVGAIASVLGRDAAWVRSVQAFRIDPRDRLDVGGAMAVAMTPALLSQLPSFKAWRTRIASTPNGFASIAGVHRNILTAYERSVGQPMPESLMTALFRLGLTGEQVMALGKLPPEETDPTDG